MSNAVYGFPHKFGIEAYTSIKSRFHGIAAREVLKDVCLTGKVAMVTGANSGLGMLTVCTNSL